MAKPTTESFDVERKARSIIGEAHNAIGKELPKTLVAIREQIIQRIVLLLVLISENANTSSVDSERNMFRVDENEAEGVVIAKSQREITALVRVLIWLESDSGGLCSECGQKIEDLSVEKAIEARCSVQCTKDGE